MIFTRKEVYKSKVYTDRPEYADFGLYNLMEEHQNIEACAIILNKLSQKFDTENEVVMAYNLGEGKA